MSRWLTLGFVCALGGCGGEDGGGDGMAEEVGGECVFTPGSYVLSYEVLDATSTCGAAADDPLPDEYMTVTADGSLVGTGAEDPPTGCSDGNFVTRGCFVSFDRVCTQDTQAGRIESTIGYQFWYDDGEGQVTFTGRLYSGSTLLDTCVINFSATVRRR